MPCQLFFPYKSLANKLLDLASHWDTSVHNCLKSSNKRRGAYSKTFQSLPRYCQKLNEKGTEIMCQNLFTGRIVQNVLEIIILFVFLSYHNFKIRFIIRVIRKDPLIISF